ncbi:ubiquinol-cytochrome-c reductase complex subunit-domain-containing protein [Podospora didyma]|uniref:Ubiquinol-cytochrome-c reductase complex subunit-domain-containing protein n=1 Tax=Podospora didyma TaxID=330526 RepID=A0AAE0NYJ2_9PEZI|nr:ubiquinol-cytochrome-c reductase complex subunit-domain-containing protein [Podospora didyma]
MPFPTPSLRASAYPKYQSPYGPKYTYQPHVFGLSLTPKALFPLAVKASAFGGVALFAVIFYASGIPKIQQDILMKVPYLRNYYVNDKPASDSPF